MRSTQLHVTSQKESQLGWWGEEEEKKQTKIARTGGDGVRGGVLVCDLHTSGAGHEGGKSSAEERGELQAQ